MMALSREFAIIIGNKIPKGDSSLANISNSPQNLWTMRQEAKLSFLKRVSRSSNYKNVAKTVARGHQFWLCHQMQMNPHMLTPQLEVSPKQLSNTLACEDDYLQHEFMRIFSNLSADSVVGHPSWVNLQSSHFCKGLYVLLKYDTMHPVFGKITDLVIINHTLIISVIEYFLFSLQCIYD